MAGGNGSIETLRREVRDATSIARDAKNIADQTARDIAIFDSLQEEQAKTLASMAKNHSSMLVELTKVSTNVEWLRDELAKKMDQTSAEAHVAKQVAEAAKKSSDKSEKRQGDATMAKAMSAIAMLVAIVGSLLGVRVLP